MTKQIVMAYAYTLFLGTLFLGICIIFKGDFHDLGEKIDQAGQTFFHPSIQLPKGN
jgi:hypothetical protein